MIALLVAGWFVCGIVGAFIGLKYKKARGHEIEPEDVLGVVVGLGLLVEVLIDCVAYATERTEWRK
jgi:hypothetical protein